MNQLRTRPPAPEAVRPDRPAEQAYLRFSGNSVHRLPLTALAEEGWSPADDPDADIADAGGFLYADEDALKLHPFPALVSKDPSGRAVVRQ